MNNNCNLSDKKISETVAGVEAEIFASLPKDDQVFLRLLERMGLTLAESYERLIEKKVVS